MSRHRKNKKTDITPKVLSEIDTTIQEFDRYFHALIAPLMKQEGHTLKYHKISHVTDTIRRLGRLSEYSAQFYECSNKQHKNAYNASNRRVYGDPLQQITANQTLMEVFGEHTTFNAEGSLKRRQSAYMTAHETGGNAMAAKATVRIPTTPDATLSQSVQAYIEQLGDFNDVRDAVVKYFSNETPRLLVRSTAVLNARVEWLDADSGELQTIRATPDFFSRPYYDTVMFQYTTRGRTNSRYGQVRMIFKARDPSTSIMHELACMRLFQEQDTTRNVLISAGCVHLAWPMTRLYMVVPLDEIVRRVYLVPDFTRRDAEFYYVSSFKWNRVPIQDYVA